MAVALLRNGIYQLVATPSAPDEALQVEPSWRWKFSSDQEDMTIETSRHVDQHSNLASTYQEQGSWKEVEEVNV